MKYVLPFLLLLAACGDDSVTELKGSDSITFGQFFGFCIGEQCIEIYKLTKDGLYEDSNDTYPARDKFYQGKFTKLSDDKFRIAAGFETKIPSALLNQQERVIGQPDAGDWGGYYVEVNQNGKREFWIVDKNQQNLPDNLKPFAQELNDLIAALTD
ncbi:MAG: hypothetical protein ACKOAR_05445 [Bacteroidota bacterium]